MKINFQERKGITLVALVITIIILLILAGITIAQLTESGLFARAIQASEETKISEYTEKIELIKAEVRLNKSNPAETPTLNELKDAFDNENWVDSTDIIMDNDIEKLKLITKEGYIFYITVNKTEYKGKGIVVDTSALERDDVLKLEITTTNENGRMVKITDITGVDYYKIQYQIGSEDGEWTEIKSGNEVEVPFGKIIYARLIYGTNYGVTYRMSIAHTDPTLTLSTDDYSNVTRKTDIPLSDLFQVTWGSEGVGKCYYFVKGKLKFNNKDVNYNANLITNLSELELGTYTIGCGVATPTQVANNQYEIGSGHYITVNISKLKNTTVTNSNDESVVAYAIYSEYDLAYFRDLVNGGNTTLNAKQMLDINLVNVSSKNNGGWNAIGYYNGNGNWGGIGYAGIYEGNSKKITIYSSDISNNKTGGIFGMIIGGTVRNLETEGTIDASIDFVGGIVGAMKNGKISNCINNCTITDTAGMYHGGIVGLVEKSTIDNCINNGTVYGKSSIGGIVGSSAEQTNITNCSNSGRVCCYGTEKRSWGSITGYYGTVGGIVGQSNDSQISNCENSGNIYGDSKNMENHGIAAGGIVGWATNSDISLSRSKGGVIYYCPNQLTDNGGALGGIAGALMSSTINQCFNTSNVSSKFITGEYMQDNSGGIVGYGSAATIKNVYNTGMIGGHSNVGGICGNIDTSVGQNDLYNAYNASENISGTTSVGNIVGLANRVTGKYCGYIKETTQIGNSVNSTFSNCTEYELEQMKTTDSGLLTLLKNGDGSELWAQSSSGLPYLVNNQP